LNCRSADHLLIAIKIFVKTCTFLDPGCWWIRYIWTADNLNIAKKLFFYICTFLKLCICQSETELNLDPEFITDPDPKLQMISDPDPQLWFLHQVCIQVGTGTALVLLKSRKAENKISTLPGWRWISSKQLSVGFLRERKIYVTILVSLERRVPRR
jgi:hypothetical protein